MPAKRTTSTETKATADKTAEAKEVKQVNDTVQNEENLNNAEIPEQPKAEEQLKEQPKKEEDIPHAPVANLVETEKVAMAKKPEVKRVKVKFLKNHDFNIGTEKISAKKDDIKMVEMHIANKLLGRQIAYILG